MPVGRSARVVVELEPEVKRRMYAQLAREGRTMKDWFRERVDRYLTGQDSQTRLPLAEHDED